MALTAIVLLLGAGMAVITLSGKAVAATTATARVSSFERGTRDLAYRVEYTAAAGQTGDLSVTVEKSGGGSALTYTYDGDVTIAAGTGCVYPDTLDLTRVECTIDLYTPDPDLGEPGPSAVTRLNSQDDTVSFTDLADSDVPHQILLGAPASGQDSRVSSASSASSPSTSTGRTVRPTDA